MVETSVDKERSPAAVKRKHAEEGANDGDEGRQPSTSDAPAKRAKTMGPAMPPPGMIPTASDSSDESDDDDDDYGPALPPAKGDASNAEESSQPADVKVPAPTRTEPSGTGSGSATKDAGKRDDWMLRPPDELDLSSRVDPTKLRNRKFNSGPRTNTSSSSGPSKMWTETPDEKRKRLENEVMGVQAPASSGGEKSKAKQPSEDEDAISKQVREYNEKKRNKSLYKQHQGKSAELEKDDPSARAFDKEKDIRAPSKVTNSQRREMLNKASEFGSRFSGGSFL